MESCLLNHPGLSFLIRQDVAIGWTNMATRALWSKVDAETNPSLA